MPKKKGERRNVCACIPSMFHIDKFISLYELKASYVSFMINNTLLIRLLYIASLLNVTPKCHQMSCEQICMAKSVPLWLHTQMVIYNWNKGFSSAYDIYSTACGTSILNGKINKTDVTSLEILTSSAGYLESISVAIHPKNIRSFRINSNKSEWKWSNLFNIDVFHLNFYLTLVDFWKLMDAYRSAVSFDFVQDKKKRV